MMRLVYSFRRAVVKQQASRSQDDEVKLCVGADDDSGDVLIDSRQ